MDGTDGPDGTGVGWGGMEGPTLSGAGTGAPPLALEERWAAGGGQRAAGGERRAAGSGKQWLAPISLVLQGCGLIVSEQKNNTNRLHKNCNEHVVQDSINNTYDKIVLWLYTNPNL